MEDLTEYLAVQMGLIVMTIARTFWWYRFLPAAPMHVLCAIHNAVVRSADRMVAVACVECVVTVRHVPMANVWPLVAPVKGIVHKVRSVTLPRGSVNALRIAPEKIAAPMVAVVFVEPAA